LSNVVIERKQFESIIQFMRWQIEQKEMTVFLFSFLDNQEIDKDVSMVAKKKGKNAKIEI